MSRGNASTLDVVLGVGPGLARKVVALAEQTDLLVIAKRSVGETRLFDNLADLVDPLGPTVRLADSTPRCLRAVLADADLSRRRPWPTSGTLRLQSYVNVR
jgi:hypothetical protein